MRVRVTFCEKIQEETFFITIPFEVGWYMRGEDILVFCFANPFYHVGERVEYYGSIPSYMKYTLGSLSLMNHYVYHFLYQNHYSMDFSPLENALQAHGKMIRLMEYEAWNGEEGRTVLIYSCPMGMISWQGEREEYY